MSFFLLLLLLSLPISLTHVCIFARSLAPLLLFLQPAPKPSHGGERMNSANFSPFTNVRFHLQFLTRHANGIGGS